MADGAAFGGGRDELSRLLRVLRASSGLTQAESGRLAGVGQRAISRFERGRYVPTEPEARALVTAYRASSDVAAQLIQLVADIRGETPPARVVLQRAETDALQQRISRIEKQAEHIRSFQPGMVIGLLQSAGYVHTVFHHSSTTSADADAAAATRLHTRQALLANAAHRFTFIQTEGSLRWMLGAPAVMAEQLDHIAALATSADHIGVGIIPWTTPARLTAPHGFHLYDQRAVSVPTKSGMTILTDPRDVADYGRLFASLETLAEFGDAARATAKRIADEYRNLR